MKTKITFDDIFITLATTLAKKSHCVKKQVGAVLATDTRIVSIGYNGPPTGTYNCDEKWPDIGCPMTIRGGCSLSLHAEQNTIIYALNNKATLQGASLYVTLSPCLPCARIIFSVGIKKVVYLESYAAYKNITSDEGLFFLNEFGVTTELYTFPLTEPLS